MIVRSFAPAKINLFLHVGPPRADGRHPLFSLAAFADVGDLIVVRDGEGLSLSASGQFAKNLPLDASNLVLRAAGLLAREAGISAPQAAIELQKELPIASGIGGGSSDAAAALRALNIFWKVRAGDGELARIAREIGADAPVCVSARPALMRGGGEDIEAIATPDLFAVLVNCGAAIETAAAYRRFDELGGGACFYEDEAFTLSDGAPQALAELSCMRNDLTEAALDLAPQVGDSIAALRARSSVRLARMSGSGATCFGLVDDIESAHGVAAALRDYHPAWWVRAARLGAVDVSVGAL